MNCRRDVGKALAGDALGRCCGFLLVVTGAVACSDGGQQVVDTQAQLRAVGEVALDERDLFVGNITSDAQVDIADDGTIAVGDRLNYRLVLFDETGAFQDAVGRQGQGPGEFAQIAAVGWLRNGRVAVSTNDRRISIFNPALSLDTTWHAGEADFVSGFHPIGENLLLNEYANPRMGLDGLRIYDPDGRLLASFDPPDERGSIPYLGGSYRRALDVSGDRVYAMSSLSYPVRIYNHEGVLVDSMGTPPPSFTDPREPEAGEWALDPSGYAEWRRSFGTVGSLWIVGDSLLLVQHRYLDPEVLDQEVPYYLLDVYHLPSGRKVGEEIPLPGFIADTYDDRIWVLTAGPPDPWTFTLFEVEEVPAR